MKAKIKEGTEVIEFIVTVRAFSAALALVGKAIASNPVVTIIENVHADLNEGILALTATDLNLTIIKTVECFPGEMGANQNGRFLIPYKLMTDLLKTLPETPVTIIHENTSQNCMLTLILEGKKFRMSTEHHIDFPKKLHIEGPSITIIDTHLKEALTICLKTASIDDLKPGQCGINFNLQNELLILASTNGHILSMVETEAVFDQGLKGESFTIYNKTADVIKSVIESNEKQVMIIKSSAAIKIETDLCTIISQLNTERFPDFQNAIPKTLPLETNISLPEWRSELKRAVLFSNQTTKAIVHTFGGGQLQLSSEDMDYGNESTQQISIDGDAEITIGFNGNMLSGLLQNLSGQAKVRMVAPNRATLIEPKASTVKSITLLIMPVMLNT